MKALKKEEPALLEAAQETNSAAITPEAEMTASKVTPQPQIAVTAKASAEPSMAAEVKPVEDDAIRGLAKRRVATKRNLIGQALDFLLIVVVAITLANFSYGDAMAVAFFFCIFWGLRLLYRIYKFMQPSFKDGIAAYLHKRKEQQLEAEYNRLKRMGKEYVTHELSR